MTAPRRVALLGGSFDPPHLGHLLMATWALASERFDEVRWVPVFGHAFGKSLTPFDVRCALVDATVAHLGERARVEPIEAQLPVPSYTVDTVRALQAQEPDVRFTWMLGADAWAHREKWKEWSVLESLVDFVVFGRAGTAHPDALPTTLPDVSSTKVRRRVAAGDPIGPLVLPAVATLIDAHGLYR